MGFKDLFKKYGSKDYITLKFNLSIKKYEYTFYDGTVVPYNKLDNLAKKELDSKNQELINNPHLLDEVLDKTERENKIIARAKELSEMGYPCISTTIVSDQPISHIPDDFNQELNNLLSEEHVLYGIHRTGYMKDDYLLDILENGLIMTGRGVYVSQDDLSLDQNVGYYPDNMQIKDELLNAHGYKESNGSLLIRIPDEDLKKGDLFIQKENDFMRLKPEYIVGYVPIIQLSDGSYTINRIMTLKDLKQTKEENNNDNKEIVFEESINSEEDNTIRRGR